METPAGASASPKGTFTPPDPLNALVLERRVKFTLPPSVGRPLRLSDHERHTYLPRLLTQRVCIIRNKREYTECIVENKNDFLRLIYIIS